MTGYGSGDAVLGRGRLVVEVRAVNHRFLEPRVRLPSVLGDHAAVVEDILRRRLGRGRVEAGARLEGTSAGAIELDRERAREAYRALSELRDELRPEEPVPLSLLATVPGLFVEHGGPAAEEVRAALSSATDVACAALDRMRVREGEALAVVLLTHVAEVRRAAAEVKLRCPEVVESHRVRLGERLARLLADGTVEVDPARLEHEVALFADRSDVTEEVERLESHCDQFEELLAEDGPIGRKLDFLLQEMGREANTLGSKSSDVALVRLVVDLKAEIERLREQVQNVY
jgi:uncharacterized protein (TIGR00255 family)